MCLKTHQRKQQTAQQPITVYKIVEKRVGFYYTPFNHTPIPLEVIKGLQPFYSDGKTSKTKDGYGFLIDKGCIHTYATASDAFSAAAYWERISGKEHIVYECVIEKGTKFYKGYGSRSTHQYASKSIRFVKLLQNPLLSKSTQTELDLR